LRQNLAAKQTANILKTTAEDLVSSVADYKGSVQPAYLAA